MANTLTWYSTPTQKLTDQEKEKFILRELYGDNPDLGLLLGPPLERLDDGVLLLSLTLGNLERLREAVILLLEGVNLLNLPLSHLERLSDGVVLLLERVNDVILLLNLLISPVGVGEDG